MKKTLIILAILTKFRNRKSKNLGYTTKMGIEVVDGMVRPLMVPKKYFGEEEQSSIDDLRINQCVYHSEIYGGKEQMKIVGLRENEVELEGDYSGGTHNTVGRQWFPIKGLIVK